MCIIIGSFSNISLFLGVILVFELLVDFEGRTFLVFEVLDQGLVVIREGLEVVFDLGIALVLFLILCRNKISNQGEGLILSTLEGFVHDREDFLVLTVLRDSANVGLELLHTSLFDHALVLQSFSLIFNSINFVPVDVRILELTVFLRQLSVVLLGLLKLIFLLFQSLLLHIELLLKDLELFHLLIHFLLESGVVFNCVILVKLNVLVFPHFVFNYC